MQFTAASIAAYLHGTVDGNPDTAVHNVAKIEQAVIGDLVFLSNPKYEPHIYTTGASVVIVNNDFAPQKPLPGGIALVRVANAYSAFASLLSLYQASKPRKQGIHPLASIHPSAQIGEEVYIGPYAVIDEGATVGKGALIYPHVYVGDRVSIGAETKLFAGVKIYEDCVIGNRVTIHGGSIIGGDGFGFAPNAEGGFDKIAQIGNVVIEGDVEIGANCCIDRATMGSTVIKQGAKLDNLIQIAHNVVIGENTVMASQVGIAGSTKIGRNVMMGGQVGIVGHLTIADGVKIASQSGIGSDIVKEGEMLFGSPALPGIQGHRINAAIKDLPNLRRQVQELAREIKRLKGELQ